MKSNAKNANTKYTQIHIYGALAADAAGEEISNNSWNIS